MQRLYRRSTQRYIAMEIKDRLALHAPLGETPFEEAERLTALRALNILDTPPEERFDRITRLAAELLDVPIAYVSFVDEHREWLKSSQGWDVSETPRDASICALTMCNRGPLIIPDALADARFRTHPMVVDAPHARFYAGYPLRSSSGHIVGTFGVADRRPRHLNRRARGLLTMLAEMVEHEMNLVDVIQLQLDALVAKVEAEAAHRERAEALHTLVEHRQHLTDELVKAAAYVQSLLPAPQTGPISTDWVFIPSAELGGDAFGYHWLDDDHFAMYLLDVSGHNIGAALHSVSVLNVLRTQTLRATNFHNPSDVLAALNAAFQMKQHHNMYFTIWYGVFDRKTRRLTYATGGHPPALLVTNTDGPPQIEQLRTRGLMIGGMREVAYPGASIIVPEGSSLYLFSDGIYEIRREEDAMMDLDDFVNLITENAAAGHYEVAHIVERIDQLQRCETCLDDVALLRVRFD